MAISIWKTSSIVLRTIGFALAIAVIGLCIAIIRAPVSGTQPKAQVICLLLFAMITAIQSIYTFSLAVLSRPSSWAILGDMISVCGYATCTLLLRGVTQAYSCGTFLHANRSAGGSDAVIMRRDEILIDNSAAPEMFDIDGLDKMAENVHGMECTALKIIFGVAVAGCTVSLLGAATVVMAVKRRNQERMMMEDMVQGSKERAILRDQRWEPMRGKRDSEDGASRMTNRGFP